MLIMAVGLTQKAGVATVTGNARRDGGPMPAPLQFEAFLAAFHTRGSLPDARRGKNMQYSNQGCHARPSPLLRAQADIVPSTRLQQNLLYCLAERRSAGTWCHNRLWASGVWHGP